jgi:hypothetical protein
LRSDFGISPLDEYVTPRFELIGRVWTALVGVLELGFGACEIAMLRECHAPRVVPCRKIWCERHRVGVRFLGCRPIASMIQYIAAKAITIHQ